MAIFIEKRGIAPQIEELNSQTGENTQDSLGPFQFFFEEMISRDGSAFQPPKRSNSRPLGGNRNVTVVTTPSITGNRPWEVMRKRQGPEKSGVISTVHPGKMLKNLVKTAACNYVYTQLHLYMYTIYKIY